MGATSMFGKIAVGGAMFALAFVIAFSLAHVTQQRETIWCGGQIERGSLVPTEHGHRFTIRGGWGCGSARFDVVQQGKLPDTVCDGSEVGLEGRMVAGVFHAVRVYGHGASKYDACQRWRCKPEHERPENCRLNRDLKFE